MKKKPTVQRVETKTKRQIISESASREWAHVDTATINSRRKILAFEISEIDINIIQAVAEVNSLKERKATIEALLDGMDAVIDRR